MYVRNGKGEEAAAHGKVDYVLTDGNVLGSLDLVGGLVSSMETVPPRRELWTRKEA